WSSDVCSSDLGLRHHDRTGPRVYRARTRKPTDRGTYAHRTHRGDRPGSRARADGAAPRRSADAPGGLRAGRGLRADPAPGVGGAGGAAGRQRRQRRRRALRRGRAGAALRAAGGGPAAVAGAAAVGAGADLVGDGLVGIAVRGALREPQAGLAARTASTDAAVVAVDLPSGVGADTGAVPGASVRAGVTVA